MENRSAPDDDDSRSSSRRLLPTDDRRDDAATVHASATDATAEDASASTTPHSSTASSVVVSDGTSETQEGSSNAVVASASQSSSAGGSSSRDWVLEKRDVGRRRRRHHDATREEETDKKSPIITPEPGANATSPRSELSVSAGATVGGGSSRQLELREWVAEEEGDVIRRRGHNIKEGTGSRPGKNEGTNNSEDHGSTRELHSSRPPKEEDGGKLKKTPIPEKLPLTAPSRNNAEEDQAPADTPLAAAAAAVPETVPIQEPSADLLGQFRPSSSSLPESTRASIPSVRMQEQGDREREGNVPAHLDQNNASSAADIDTLQLGAVAMPGTGTTEGRREHPPEDGQTGRNVSLTDVPFSAQVVCEERGPRQGQQGERLQNRHPPQVNPTEQVYDGVAIPSRENEGSNASAWMQFLQKHKVLIVLSLLACLAVAVAVPVAVSSRRSDNSVTNEVTSGTAAVSSSPSFEPSFLPTSTSSIPSASPAPSAHPTSERLHFIKALLVSEMKRASISTGAELLEDATSHRYEAFSWVIEEDGRFVNEYDNETTGVVQRFVLASLFFATRGESWHDDLGFLSGAHECEWHNSAEVHWQHGIPRGVSCSNNATIDSIYLNWNGLNGTLPEELALLQGVEHLIFTTNSNLRGPIPSSLGKLTKLTYLDLSSNSLSGTIPTSIGELTKLTHIYLSDNSLSGGIPTEMNNLKELEVLILASNSITGTLPFIANSLPSLQRLGLGSNHITGDLPRSLFSYSNLTSLYLGYNQLTGTLPNEVGNLLHLERLSLRKNSVQGSLPSEIGRLSQLGLLYLENNSLTGTISGSMGNMSSLAVLFLHFNQLNGTLPHSMASLTRLRLLVLSRNKLDGTLPDIFENLQSLSLLLLDANKFIGPIPPSLAQHSLYDFSVANTSLTGDMALFCNKPREAIADCYGENPEIICTCCIVCCSDDERSSNLTTSDLRLDNLFGKGHLRGCFRTENWKEY